MIIDIFTAEVERLKTKFETGDKPTGKDFNDLISLFYDFYQDMIGGLTPILAEQIESANGNRTVENVDLGLQTTDIVSISATKSKIYQLSVSNQLLTNLQLTGFPDNERSSTILLYIHNQNVSQRAVVLQTEADIEWLDGDSIYLLDPNAKYLVSVTTNLGGLGKMVATYRKIGI